MYLALLNDKEKELFLGLAYDLVTSDGEYSGAEKATIDGYCQEMMFKFNEKTMIRQIDSIIDEFNRLSNDKVKRIIVFESIGLAMADNHYDIPERELIKKMEDSFGLEKEYASCCEKLLNEYISFQDRIDSLVNK